MTWEDQRQDIAALWEAVWWRRRENRKSKSAGQARKNAGQLRASEALGGEARHPTGKHWTPR